ncbi:MAG: ribosome small subunit-dependent GTPase A, partial [Noviherbaspirillum sp.]
MSSVAGLVVAAHGRHYVAQADGLTLHCVTRGKKSDVAVGDMVRLKQTSPDQGVIEAIEPRQTLLYRSDQYKSKLLAANLTRMFIVVATEPGFSDDLVSRALIAAEAAGIEPYLILNKTDIEAALPRARERLALYTGLGYPVLELSARAAPEAVRATLLPLLEGQSSILIGQSGMGKSSLIQLLVPDIQIAVREISAALDSGKHTTTYTRLYHA